VKHKTNTAAVRDMMEYSNFGALAQLFIIDAISKHAEAVSKATPESVDTGLIAGAAWVGVAKEIRAKMDVHLNVKRQEPTAQTGEDHPKDKAISAATFQHSADAEPAGGCTLCGQHHQYGDVCP
jgi:hypothetical protein